MQSRNKSFSQQPDIQEYTAKARSLTAKNHAGKAHFGSHCTDTTGTKKLQGWSALESVLIVYATLDVELAENLEERLAIADGHLVNSLVYLVVIVACKCHHVVILWESLDQCSCRRNDHLIVTL